MARLQISDDKKWIIVIFCKFGFRFQIMKKSLITLSVLLVSVICLQAETKSRAERIAAEMQNPKSNYVAVAVHRGDWRNFPENSIPAIESVIRMGADMVEIDIKMTKDSVLVVSHDRTLDRCTTGKGLISEHTYAEIQAFTLRRAHGIATDSLRMPTLREALQCCKDRICVNVDHGYEYYEKVLQITEELGVTGQILIKGRKPVAEVAADMARYPRNMMYMPIIDILRERGMVLFADYQDSGVVPMAYEVCWNRLTPEVESCFDSILESGSKLWVNTIWGSLCGYLDDDAALDASLRDGTPASVYDQVLNLGASIIQTDRPALLIPYLQSVGRHTLAP